MKPFTLMFFALSAFLLLTGRVGRAEELTGSATNFGGPTTLYNFSDDTTGSATNFGGGTTFYNFSNGLTGTATNFGGGTTFYNFSNGLTGSATHLGGSTIYNFSDGEDDGDLDDSDE